MKYVAPSKRIKWPICREAVDLIAETEGVKLKAYLCPAGVWTIGRGKTRGVKQGDQITIEQADQLFLEDLTSFTNRVRPLLQREPTENQLGAMVSLAYNIGVGSSDPRLPGGFTRSTVLRKFNQGDNEGSAEAFKMWNKARVNGKLQELRGLTIRRAREAALFLTPEKETLGTYIPPTSHSIPSEEIKPPSSTTSDMAKGATATAVAIESANHITTGEGLLTALSIDPTMAAIFAAGLGAGFLIDAIRGRK